MGQRAHRDVVYSFYGRIDQNGLGRHAAGRLDLRAARRSAPPPRAPRRASCCPAAAAARPRPAPRRSPRRRAPRPSIGRSGRAARAAPHRLTHAARQRRVVLLDQDRVVEAGAVVDAAAVRDRRLLEPPQPRRGLARVEQLRGPARARGRATPRARSASRCRDSRPRKFERRPLGGQQRPRAALDHEHDRARLAPHALGPELDRPRRGPGGGRPPRRRRGRRSRPAPSG